MRSDVIVKCVRSPNSSARTAAAAPLTHEWPDGYPGWPGVANNGTQAGSGVVAGLPSSAISRMAVIGRQ